MTVKLELDAQTEASIAAQAAARGVPVQTFLQSLIQKAANQGQPGAATLALFEKWNAEDDTLDPVELERRRAEFEEFKAGVNANRSGERVIYP
jgi:hypothetical protein